MNSGLATIRGLAKPSMPSLRMAVVEDTVDVVQAGSYGIVAREAIDPDRKIEP